jgi:hypothetical protein
MILDDEPDIAEPQPGSITFSGKAVCHHCVKPIVRAAKDDPEYDWVHADTNEGECS